MMITSQSPMEVLVNDVKVGEIDSNDWESLKRQVRRDKRTYVTHGVSFILVLTTQLMKDCLAMPLIILAVISLYAISSPQSFNSIITTDLENTLLALRNYSIAVLLFTSFVRVLFRAGFRNAFEEEAFRLLRLHVNCPATGTILLRKKQR